MQHEISGQHRQLAAYDAELSTLHATHHSEARAEGELRISKNGELLSFMRAHALVVEQERRLDENRAQTASLWRELEELQSAAAGARISRLASPTLTAAAASLRLPAS